MNGEPTEVDLSRRQIRYVTVPVQLFINFINQSGIAGLAISIDILSGFDIFFVFVLGELCESIFGCLVSIAGLGISLLSKLR